VAPASAIGTMVTFGTFRCEMKAGCMEIASSFAAMASDSTELVALSIVIRRGRNLPYLRQNWVIRCVYPGSSSSDPRTKVSPFNRERTDERLVAYPASILTPCWRNWHAAKATEKSSNVCGLMLRTRALRGKRRPVGIYGETCAGQRRRDLSILCRTARPALQGSGRHRDVLRIRRIRRIRVLWTNSLSRQFLL